jgi:hypothetical protein
MDELTERARRGFAPVEAAARSYPLADTPPGFSAAVMGRVRATSPMRPFRVTWQEIIPSLFLAGMAVVASAAWFSLPPQTAIYIQMRIVLLWRSLLFAHLGWVVLAGGLVMMAALLAAIVWLLRPRYHRLKTVSAAPSRFPETLK